MKPPASGSATRSRAALAPQREFRNDKALIGWIFMLVWLSLLACFSYLFVRDGGIPQLGIWGLPVIGLFWVFGMAGFSWAASLARIRLVLGAEGVLLRERFPFSHREKRYYSRDIAAPFVAAGKDSEGDPCYYCVIAFTDGHRVHVAEGSDKAELEAVRERLQASLLAFCRGYDGRTAAGRADRHGSDL